MRRFAELTQGVTAWRLRAVAVRSLVRLYAMCQVAVEGLRFAAARFARADLARLPRCLQDAIAASLARSVRCSGVSTAADRLPISDAVMLTSPY